MSSATTTLVASRLALQSQQILRELQQPQIVFIRPALNLGSVFPLVERRLLETRDPGEGLLGQSVALSDGPDLRRPEDAQMLAHCFVPDEHPFVVNAFKPTRPATANRNRDLQRGRILAKSVPEGILMKHRRHARGTALHAVLIRTRIVIRNMLIERRFH